MASIYPLLAAGVFCRTPNAKCRMPNTERLTTERRMLVSGFSCETCTHFRAFLSSWRYLSSIFIYTIVSVVSYLPFFFVSAMKKANTKCIKMILYILLIHRSIWRSAFGIWRSAKYPCRPPCMSEGICSPEGGRGGLPYKNDRSDRSTF